MRLVTKVWVFAIPLFVGCSSGADQNQTLTLATTTSTQDSGLLDALLPLFERQTGIDVKVVAVGSGQALELGRRGDADVLLTHAPSAEEDFMAAGYGLQRRAVMYNDFVIVGPPSDPSNVRGKKVAGETLAAIAKAKARFVSRGDNSGTHMKENQIWKATGVAPKGEWYVQAGGGMAQALRMASEKQAYTLTDRATFLAQRKHLELEIMCEGDSQLQNHYTVIVVNPEKHAHIQHGAAKRFSEFLVSPDAQKTIEQFGREVYGQPLFFPEVESRGIEK